jgi:anti-anti-sigma factor
MELLAEKRSSYLYIVLRGRLDASWADYFTENVLDWIRKGEHILLFDASQLDFLSSAGIRALFRVDKELSGVSGSFGLVNATEFVAGTLQTTGLGSWLTVIPDEIQAADEEKQKEVAGNTDRFLLHPDAVIRVRLISHWDPWSVSPRQNAEVLDFERDMFALGLGEPSTGQNPDHNLGQTGEFLAVAGNVIYQAPQPKAHPDYLLPRNDYLPRMNAVQAICCQGAMKYLERFDPGEEGQPLSLGSLAQKALADCASDAAAIVILAESGGLVGACLSGKPQDTTENQIDANTMRQWLSFSGEKVHFGALVLAFGIVSKKNMAGALRPLEPGLQEGAEVHYGHFHATVFAYQPLPNGKIDLEKELEKRFAGPQPEALYHLLYDDRPGAGLGGSSFVRGALWSAPIIQ